MAQESPETATPETDVVAAEHPSALAASGSDAIIAEQPAADEVSEADAVIAEQPVADEVSEADAVIAEQPAADEVSDADAVIAEQPAADEVSEADADTEEQEATDEPSEDDALAEQKPAAPAPAARDPVRDYLSAIEQAEREDGAYSTALADLYQGLGRSLVEQEKFEEAKKAFQRGLQIERVNFGLNSVKQQDYLYAIADIEVRSDDWKATESILQNVYLINAKNYGEKNPAMSAGLFDMIRWYVSNYKLRSPVNGYLNLSRAEELAQQLEGIVEHQYGLHHPNTTEILRQTSQLHYFMLGLLAEYGELINMALAPYSIDRPENMRGNRMSVTDNLLRMGADNYSKIIESIEQQDGTTPLEHVEAIARLGDWHLIFGQRQTAGKIYQRAYGVVASSEDPDPDLASYFAEPRLVSFVEDEDDSATDGESGNEVKTVKVSMTIEPSGRPYDIEVLDPPEFMTKQLIGKTEQSVRHLPFRPRLDNGRPVQTKGFIMEYPIRESDIES